MITQPSASTLQAIGLIVAALCFLSPSSLHSSNEEDFGLPGPVADTQFDSLKARSPFTRVLNLSETLQLTGLAVIDGEEVATIEDRSQGKRFTISGEANEDGWKMVSAESCEDIDRVKITITSIRGELVTLQYDKKRLRSELLGRTKEIEIKIPEGPDRRSLPTDREKREFGEWARKRMKSMTDEQRNRVGKLIQEKIGKNPNLTIRQRGEVFVQILEAVDPKK
ncbi:MAG: hypothetical protein AAGF67_14335, partial [Verrucomicrobiota bacterium]